MKPLTPLDQLSSGRSTAVALAVVLTVVLGTGCKSKLTGNKGNFTFSYHATDDIRDFNKPVAVGAKLDLLVHTQGIIDKPVDVQEATTDAPDVLTVVSFSGNTVVLQGAGDGQALVQVTGRTSQGQTLDDEVNMQARVPEVLKINHSCTTGTEARYLVGQQEVWLHFDMEMANGQAVIGYGYHPVTFDPADAVTVDQTSKAQEFIGMSLTDAETTISVASDIDDSALTMILVPPTVIDGAELDEAGTRTPILVDRNRLLHVTPTTGGAAICQAKTPVQGRSDTPDLCSITADDDPADVGPVQGALEKWGFLSVKGIAPGACKFTIWHPASGDVPVETQFGVTIGELDTGDAELDE